MVSVYIIKYKWQLWNQRCSQRKRIKSMRNNFSLYKEQYKYKRNDIILKNWSKILNSIFFLINFQLKINKNLLYVEKIIIHVYRTLFIRHWDFIINNFFYLIQLWSNTSRLRFYFYIFIITSTLNQFQFQQC